MVVGVMVSSKGNETDGSPPGDAPVGPECPATMRRCGSRMVRMSIEKKWTATVADPGCAV